MILFINWYIDKKKIYLLYFIVYKVKHAILIYLNQVIYEDLIIENKTFFINNKISN
jgi:hypothetical protein